MQKLYYENPYKKEFTAEIINILEKDNKYHIELAQTYFYPEGGGQPSDTGYINSIPVTHVYEENEKIYHVTERNPMKIHRVKCSIDCKKRYDHMQHHLGQHIISACFVELFNANTIGFHLGKDSSTIDIDKLLSKDEIRKAEEEANKIIFDNINVEILYPTKTELKKLRLRKTPPKTAKKIRIVKIGDIDINACCGIHPNSTIEVQLIKVSKWEKYKNGTRIHFLCGSRAVSDYFYKHDSIERMSNLLSCSDSNVLCEVERLKKELNKTVAEKRELKEEVSRYEVQNMLNSCESIKNIKILKSIYENVDLKDINNLASKLISFPNVIVLFGVKSEDKAQLLFMRSKDLNILSMNNLLKDAITLIDGKGGGSDFSAQGGGKNNNNVDSAIEYAYNKVKDFIISNLA
ncbi:alanyl-tRNA editing protein [Clostridium ganghwense]|uniref:DHHA1 domain-containing protein n=1 Tax=Clostridium ganghwense TaxID=312089 RepID=A0ABT4CJW6_9CLOT|nr:DHHA1 domain-containing protein [Clostridium ganghwense]MCY6369339.1 DHHA1 domain-containing protein [Clostridium ganghwense]